MHSVCLVFAWYGFTIRNYWLQLLKLLATSSIQKINLQKCRNKRVENREWSQSSISSTVRRISAGKRYFVTSGLGLHNPRGTTDSPFYVPGIPYSPMTVILHLVQTCPFTKDVFILCKITTILNKLELSPLAVFRRVQGSSSCSPAGTRWCRHEF